MLAARHLLHHRHMFWSLGSAAAGSLLERLKPRPAAGFRAPGPVVRARVAAPPDELIDDFLLHTGAAPADFAAWIPPQLFPQWGLPLALAALRGSGVPVTRVINGGCRLEQRGSLQRGRELEVEAQLVEITRDERRSVLAQRIVTGQLGAPAALKADVYGVVRRPGAGQRRKPLAFLPAGACELERWSLSSTAGRDFALLTGDVNPLHWLSPYARALGFDGTILHGFALFARVWAGLSRALAPRRLSVVDVRFVRPLTLPAAPSLWLKDDRVFVGSAREPLFLSGSFSS